ncbi:MAG TPA: acyclic terpene utilization AtuA family protein [Alphaproteobacteria bacterium]|nr:acyclic terpene utilization AtuA family protein [Alphaproteobacteria bacterium]
MATKTVRIGCCSGFWGDTSLAAPQLVHGAEIDYLVSDYLAEVTMSILARARAKSPELGYATDFVQITMKSLIRDIKDKGIKVVSNAGGINPLACRDALQQVAREAGVELKIGVVLGDNLTGRADEFRGRGITEMYSGEAFPEKVMSINAYLGGRPIARALEEGCDVVITGRCVDSAVTLGPLMYEFGWADDDYDRLSAGTLAGHIIECGAQCTGGLFTDWQRVKSWENIGYPVAEVEPDGSFTISKPDGTDGLVCFGSVAEQLLYEMGDPGAYMVPDVACDYTQVRMEEVGLDRVRVSGARGLPPTSTYKTSCTFMDGYKNQALLVIGGVDAAAKARRTAETVLARTRKMFQQRNLADYKETRIEAVGAEAMYGEHAHADSREVVMKIAVKHDQKEALEIFAREFAPAGTSMSPGTTGFGGGRPSPSPVVRMFSFLAEKEEVPVTVVVGDREIPVEIATRGGFRESASLHVEPVAAQAPEGETVRLPLIRLCYGRSGDKGNTANIGLIARRPEYLPLLRQQVTAERVKAYFAHHHPSRVERYDLPGIGGMNFMLYDALGGGGMTSLHTDNLAKAYCQVLMSMEIDVPVTWAREVEAA